MNNLVIMKDQQAVLRTNPETGEMLVVVNDVSLDYIDLLDMVSKASYKVNEFGLDNLLATVRIAAAIAPVGKDTSFLQQSVRELILRNFKGSLPSEFDIHELVKEKVIKIVEDSEIVQMINDRNHQPDLWLKVKGEEIPVEIKLSNFDLKALKQLERYIKHYNCNKGIAIGSNLVVDLPKNIYFISIEELRGAE